MAEITASTRVAAPSSSLVTLTHVTYAMHGFSALMGLLTPVLVVTAFLTGWPSIIAVIINLVKRNDVEGTYLESHFSWQLRTFFYTLLWVLVMGLLVMTLIGIPVAWALAIGVGLWVLYRIVRGWLALLDRKPIQA